MVSDVMRAALEELREKAVNAKRFYVLEKKFGLENTPWPAVPASSVLDVVEKALREVGTQQAIPLEPPMSETVRKP